MSKQNKFTDISWSCFRFDELDIHILYEILSFRQEVYNVEQDCAYQDADGQDQTALHLLGRNENMELLAYSRILPEKKDKHVSLGRIMVRYHMRGCGLGQVLMEETLKAAIEEYGNIPLQLDAQTYLKKFYSTYGFSAEGPEFLDDGLPHIKMVRTI